MALAVLPRMLERARPDPVRVEHGRPHPDRERVGLQRGEVRDVRVRGGDAARSRRDRASRSSSCCPGPIDTEIWDQPDNEPALIDIEKVPAADCAAGIADAIADDGFEYYVPAVFPGGIDAKEIAVGKAQHCDQYLRGMADFAKGLREPAGRDRGPVVRQCERQPLTLAVRAVRRRRRRRVSCSTSCGGRRILLHTEVDDARSGNGLATALIRARSTTSGCAASRWSRSARSSSAS